MSSFWSNPTRSAAPLSNDVAAARLPAAEVVEPAPPQAPATWRADLRLLGRRIKRAHRLDLYLIRLLGRPLSDRMYLQLGHLLYFGAWPDLERPRTLNEHIMAYMLRCRDPLLREAADKLRARQYVATHVGPRYLVPLYGAWPTAEEVPVETLPRPCVLKPTAASGMVMFLRERDAPEPTLVRAALRHWLRRDYSRFHREWAYHGARQLIMAEALLTAPDGTLPPDYKLWVIGGKVRLIHVDRGRFTHHTRNLYRPDWTLIPGRLTVGNHAPDPRPRRLAEMIEVAECLAQPFEFLRIDCYLVGDALYIGELTNTPGAGFERFIPSSVALELGSYWRRRD